MAQLKSGDDFSEYSIWLLGKAVIKEGGQRCWLQFFKQGESLNDGQTRRLKKMSNDGASIKTRCEDLSSNRNEFIV